MFSPQRAPSHPTPLFEKVIEAKSDITNEIFPFNQYDEGINQYDERINQYDETLLHIGFSAKGCFRRYHISRTKK